VIGTVPPLPLDLPLVPLSRRPLVLPPETVRWALASEVPHGEAGPPEVSVVVVTHGNLPVTRLCLGTVLAGQPGPAVEVVVVDNASPDGTPPFLRELADRHPAVRVLLNDRNLGFAAAINQGLEAARSDVLVILNNDVVVPPGWLARLAPLLDAADIGMVGPVTNAAPNEARVPTSYTTYGGMLGHAEARWSEHGSATFDIDVLTMFCAAMRREVFASVGHLDERFGLGMFEDDDYARRVRAAGLRLVCADGVHVHHFGEASFGALVPTGDHGELFRRNQRRFEEKWGEPWSPHRRRADPAYRDMTGRIRSLVAEVVPPGATLLVVNKGDDGLLRHEGRTAWPFPRGADGGYAGHHLGESREVVDHLLDLRRAGATHLVLPATSSWWLDHYVGLRSYLDECWPAAVEDDAASIFAWRGDP
jgi:GT2 family glycosyltransferase